MQLQRKPVPVLLLERETGKDRRAEGHGGLRSKVASETFQSMESA